MVNKSQVVTVKIYGANYITSVGHVTLTLYGEGDEKDILIDHRPSDDSASVFQRRVNGKKPGGNADTVVHLFGLNAKAIKERWRLINSPQESGKSRLEWSLTNARVDFGAPGVESAPVIRCNSTSLCISLLLVGGLKYECLAAADRSSQLSFNDFLPSFEALSANPTSWVAFLDPLQKIFEALVGRCVTTAKQVELIVLEAREKEIKENIRTDASLEEAGFPNGERLVAPGSCCIL